MTGTENGQSLSQDKDSSTWNGIKDENSGKILTKTVPLFEEIAENYPSDYYNKFCSEFGVEYTQSENILKKHQGDYKAAVKEVLNKWKMQGKATRAQLDSALNNTKTGALCAVVKEKFDEVRSKEPSKRKAEDYFDTESPTKKKRTEPPEATPQVRTQPVQQKKKDQGKKESKTRAVPQKKGSAGKAKPSVISKKGMVSRTELEVVEKAMKLRQVGFYRMAVLIPDDENVRELYIPDKPEMSNLIKEAKELKKKQQVVFTDMKIGVALNTTSTTKIEKTAKFKSNKAAKKAYTKPPFVSLLEAQNAADKERMSLKGKIKKVQEKGDKTYITLSAGKVEVPVSIWKEHLKPKVEIGSKVKTWALVVKRKGENVYINSTPSTRIKRDRCSRNLYRKGRKVGGKRSGTKRNSNDSSPGPSTSDKKKKVQPGNTKVTDSLIESLAKDIGTNENLDQLGIELGFGLSTSMRRYKEMNHAHGSVTYAGTKEMFLDWRDEQGEEKAAILKKALENSGLTLYAEKYFDNL